MLRRQQGSMLVLVAAISMIVSMAAAMALQVTAGLSHQAGLKKMRNQAENVLDNETRNQSEDLAAGIDTGTLPMETTLSINDAGFAYTASLVLEVDNAGAFPLPGYSLDSLWAADHIELQSRIANEQVQSGQRVTGFGCSSAFTGPLPDSPSSEYSVDPDGDGTENARYQFDVNGRIWRITGTAQLLIDLQLPASRQYSRAELAIFDHAGPGSLALGFVVHNPGPVAADQPNTLLVLFDQPFFQSTASLPIDLAELEDMTSGGSIGPGSRGLYLYLPPGQLEVSALTFHAYRLLFMIQLPFTDPVSGLTLYRNRLYRVDLTPGQDVSTATLDLPDSNSLLGAFVSPAGGNGFYYGNQYSNELIELPGLCTRTYQYEHN